MKKIFGVLLTAVVVVLGVPFFEPVTVSAVDDNIAVQLTVGSGISITAPADVSMSNIGLAVDTSTGGATWNVKTNDPDGYTLNVRASTAPAMRNSPHSFDDYTEATPGTPDTWSVGVGDIEFGFSGLGEDVENVNSDQYNASGQTLCDSGIMGELNTSLGFLGFETTDQLLATRSATTSTSGVDTTICFAAEQNGVIAPSGLYQATITATALVI